MSCHALSDPLLVWKSLLSFAMSALGAVMLAVALFVAGLAHVKLVLVLSFFLFLILDFFGQRNAFSACAEKIGKQFMFFAGIRFGTLACMFGAVSLFSVPPEGAEMYGFIALISFLFWIVPYWLFGTLLWPKR